MPLSVPLGPDDTTRYIVHLERIHWDAAALARHAPDSVAALTTAARESLRSHFNCFAATLLEADTSVTKHPNGTAEATARVLCDSEICAAERYESPSGEEAEAAQKWTLIPLVAQMTALKLLEVLTETDVG
jgi:hypothetical protein